jgi:hypothetical protein
MNRIASVFCSVAALLAGGDAAAQTFKCLDQAGKTTYSSTRCAELGLKEAGEVQDRINVSPAYRPPPAPASPPKASAPAAAPSEAAQAKPAEPERRCFTVKTAKGNVTRCGEKQGEEKTE